MPCRSALSSSQVASSMRRFRAHASTSSLYMLCRRSSSRWPSSRMPRACHSFNTLDDAAHRSVWPLPT